MRSGTTQLPSRLLVGGQPTVARRHAQHVNNPIPVLVRGAQPFIRYKSSVETTPCGPGIAESSYVTKATGK
jgi:hypothetical protein